MWYVCPACCSFPHDQIEAVLTSALLQVQRAALLLLDQKERPRQQAAGFALIVLPDVTPLQFGQKGFPFGFARLPPVQFHICLSLTVHDEETLRKRRPADIHEANAPLLFRYNVLIQHSHEPPLNSVTRLRSRRHLRINYAS